MNIVTNFSYQIIWIIVVLAFVTVGYMYFDQWRMFRQMRKSIKAARSMIDSLEDPEFKQKMDNLSNSDVYKEVFIETMESIDPEKQKVVLRRMEGDPNLNNLLSLMAKHAINSFQDDLLEIERMAEFDYTFLWTQKHRDELKKAKEEVRSIRTYFNSIKDKDN